MNLMSEHTFDLEVCRGADYRGLEVQHADSNGVGIDISAASLLFQACDKYGTAVLSLTETPNTNGSVVRALATEIIAAIAITAFDDANGQVQATGAGFQAIVPSVTYDDDTGEAIAAAETLQDVVEIGDRAIIAGSVSNDRTTYVSSVVDADTVGLTTGPVAESPAAGTITIERYGWLELIIDQVDVDAMLDAGATAYSIHVTLAGVSDCLAGEIIEEGKPQ